MNRVRRPIGNHAVTTVSNMVVTLHDAKTLACAFPYSVGAVARVKSLPDRRFDKDSKAWLVPVRDFERVLTLFPDASVDMRVWETVYPSDDVLLRKALVFCRNLTEMGVSLTWNGASVVAVGEIATPVLQAEVDKRAEWIVRLMGQGHVFTAVARAPREGGQTGCGAAPADGAAVLATAVINGVLDAATGAVLGADWPDATQDSDLAIVWRGIQNAALREREKAQWAERAKAQGRRRKVGGNRRKEPVPVEQAELGL